jgi:glycosyltransferase involved in cell wall biosynthesis
VLKVSVVVPVFNPGADIDDCIRSLLGQSLSDDEYELIFVDDGSTDGTSTRLDTLAAEHANVRVEHIPNSGWPGRPRNIGMDMARAPYVYFADNDDWLGAEALERLHARAERDAADIVIGKVVGHGKYVPRTLFRSDRTGVPLDWQPLLGLLTPAKLFRRARLEEHGIRFPEGRRRLEDHVFVMHAYFHARSISVLADYPCYHWVLRSGGEEANASYRAFEPSAYYGNVREVLDLVEQHTEPGELRDRLLAHWYRGKMLGRVGGGYFARRDPAYRRELYDEVRRLALERYDDGVERWLSPALRVRSRLLRAGDLGALEALAAAEAGLRADVQADTGAVIRFEARLAGGPGFRRDGDRVLWSAPAGVPDPGLDVTDEIERARVDLVVRSLEDMTEYVLPGETAARIEDDAVVQAGEASAGSVPPGRWELIAAVNVAGFSAVGRVRDRATAAPVRLRVDDGGAVTFERRLPSIAGRLARRMPRLARAARRVRAS